MRRFVINVADFVCQLGLILSTLIALNIGTETVGAGFGILIAAGVFLVGLGLLASFFCLVEIANNSAEILKALRQIHPEVSQSSKRSPD